MSDSCTLFKVSETSQVLESLLQYDPAWMHEYILRPKARHTIYISVGCDGESTIYKLISPSYVPLVKPRLFTRFSHLGPPRSFRRI